MAPRILIICRGYLGSHMSAPGIRATAQARVLADHVPGAKVTLAGTNLDFEDCLAIEQMRRDELDGIYSYDRGLDRIPGVRRLEP